MSRNVIKKPNIKYEAHDGYLYVNDSRYKIEDVSSVKTYSKYYLGMDDTPGLLDYSLIINGDKHYLDFVIRDIDSRYIVNKKMKMLEDLVKDVKSLVNF